MMMKKTKKEDHYSDDDFFVVDSVTPKDGKFIVSLVKTEPEEHVDDDYLYEWARDNYEPDPEDFHHDLD